MSRNRTTVVFLVGGLICTTLLSIVTRLAVNDEFQSWVKSHSWYSLGRVWSVMGLLVLSGIAIAVVQHRRSRDNEARRSIGIEGLTADNRRQMIARVRHDWIEGVLNQPLYESAHLRLGLIDTPSLVDNPLRLIVQELGKASHPVPPKTRISSVFDDHGGALLIVGAPGAGKTTLLLELTRELLDRAEKNKTHQIPVVFNLSSWGYRRPPLIDWLVDEMSERYNVPRKLAQDWLHAEQILLMLDGLDEVPSAYRDTLLGLINDFRKEHGFVQIAICSRTEEYSALPARLRLQGAVFIQPLSETEIEEYLEHAGRSLVAVRKAVQTDPSLKELLNTPLMVSVAAVAYRGERLPEQPRVGQLPERRAELFVRYVDIMFDRRSAVDDYSREKTVQWLTWLATSMARKSQSAFQIETLDTSWLADTTDRWLVGVTFGLLASLFSALTLGLLFGIYFGIPKSLLAGSVAGILGGVVAGLSFGLLFAVDPAHPSGAGRPSSPMIHRAMLYGRGLLGNAKPPRPVDRLQWSWPALQQAFPGGFQNGMISGLVTGLEFGLLVSLVVGLKGGLLFGSYFGLYLILGDGLVTTEVTERAYPNEGMRRSAQNAAISAILFGVGGGLIGNLLFGHFFGLLVGLVGAITVGAIKGGDFCLQHFLVRLFLWYRGSAPLDYVSFLSYACERVFLQRVGGGYIFVHRMLLEHFANLQGKTD